MSDSDWTAVAAEVRGGEPPSPPPVVPLARIERKLDALLAYFGVTAL